MTRRITFFISSLRTGGAERVCVTLADQLSRRGWDVTVAVLNLHDATFLGRLPKSIPLYDLGVAHARTALRPVCAFLTTHRPSLILVFNHQIAVVLVLARWLLRQKFRLVARSISILSVKQAAERTFWHRYLVGWLVERLYRKVDMVIAQSGAMQRDLVDHYGFQRSQVVTIPNPLGIDSSNSEWSSDSNSELIGRYFLCVGRMVEVKAFDVAIRAFAILAPRHPELRLKLVGGGPLEASLRSLAGGLGIAEQVDFLGRMDDVSPYYRGATASILTSLYEGFPNVLAESTAVGTPVIALDCPGGVRDIVIDGVNGLLVPSRCPEQLAKAMEHAASIKWDRSSVAKTAHRFHPEAIVARYEQALLA